MRPPQLRCALFPSMYLPHLLLLPATFGLQCLLPPYPYFRALYAIPVRQVRGLLPASFRFRLAADTLAVRLCASSLPTRTWDFHPLENAHAGQTKSTSKIKLILEVCLFISYRLNSLKYLSINPLCTYQTQGLSRLLFRPFQPDLVTCLHPLDFYCYPARFLRVPLALQTQ